MTAANDALVAVVHEAFWEADGLELERTLGNGETSEDLSRRLSLAFGDKLAEVLESAWQSDSIRHVLERIEDIGEADMTLRGDLKLALTVAQLI